MNPLLGILGDPAKLDLYDDQFYSILTTDASKFVFHLIGASERDVSSTEYKIMFYNFQEKLLKLKFETLPQINRNGSTSFQSRIGLFPSSVRHLIWGPNFIFAPYPANSQKMILRFASIAAIKFLYPILFDKLIPIAYFPMGGKAAERTKATKFVDYNFMKTVRNLKSSSWLKFMYLEAGSGENQVNKEIIEQFLIAQIKEKIAKKFTKSRSSDTSQLNNSDPERYIVPGSVYGGGIVEPAQIEQIFNPKGDFKLIPEIVIVGNISEKDISKTYQIIDKISELNEIPTARFNRF